MDTEQLKSTLNQRSVTVTFTKVSGEERVMECTTNLQLIPPSGWPKGKVEISEATRDKTIRVYDLKAQGWRSMVADNVIGFV